MLCGSLDRGIRRRHPQGFALTAPFVANTAIRRPMMEWFEEARLRVLVADNSRLFAEALMFTLDGDPKLEAIGYGLNGWDALDLVGSLEPDVVLVGRGLTGIDQIELTSWLHVLHPQVLPILLCETLVPDEVKAAYAAGAADCLPASRSADELLHAIS